MTHPCALSLCLLLALPLAAATTAPSTQPAPFAAETNRWHTFESGVRLCVNAPATFDPARPNLLILYATPNGNTVEQTLGCVIASGVDWHFDIQHVAAQVRRLRQLDHHHNIVLAVTQAPQRSWPAFRQANPDAGKVIESVFEEAARALPGPAPQSSRVTAVAGRSSSVTSTPTPSSPPPSPASLSSTPTTLTTTQPTAPSSATGSPPTPPAISSSSPMMTARSPSTAKRSLALPAVPSAPRTA